MTGPAHRGFTLIEVLVAMSLLAVIGVLGYRGVDSLRQSTGRLGALAGRWQEVALATDRMGRDLRQAIAVAGRAGDGRESPPLLVRQHDDGAELTFTRVGDEGGSLQRLGYRWRGAAGDLGLLIWRDFDAPVPHREYRLLPRVETASFDCLDARGNWLAEWPGAGRPTLPRAVRIRLTLAEGGAIERIFDVPAAN